MPALSEVICPVSRSAIVRGDEPSPQIDAGYPNYSADVAIEVYRNNYRGNLHDALAGAYPVIEQLVGEDFFRLHGEAIHRATSFAQRQPASLRRGNGGLCCGLRTRAGIGLPAGCRGAGMGLPPRLFCRRCSRAGPRQSWRRYRPNNIPDLILHTHPACHLVRSRYPIAAIWHAHQPGADSDFISISDSGACNALVSRKDDVVLVERTVARRCRMAAGHTGRSTAGRRQPLPRWNRIRISTCKPRC